MLLAPDPIITDLKFALKLKKGYYANNNYTRTITWKHGLVLNRVIKYMTSKGLEHTTTYFVEENSPNLTKWLSARLRCKWLFVRVPLESVRLQRLCLS